MIFDSPFSIYMNCLLKSGGRIERNWCFLFVYIYSDFVSKGNHDVTLDKEAYVPHAETYHKHQIESHERCLELISSPPIIYLNHESRMIRLKNPNGPRTIFKVFGSPRHPISGNPKGPWIFPFSYPRDGADEARQIWDEIPRDTDIVVTHTPPRNHCDMTSKYGSLGCEYLRQALWVVRPRLAICGHIHEGRGYDRVRWDVSNDMNIDNSGAGDYIPTPAGEFGELSSSRGKLPPRESKKQSLIDLTGKTLPPLDNDGCWDELLTNTRPNDPPPVAPANISTASSGSMDDDVDMSEAVEMEEPYLNEGGRNETCIINAAILATHYPHDGGRKFNAPIVVDLDLPSDDE